MNWSPIWSLLCRPTEALADRGPAHRATINFANFAEWLVYCEAHSLNIANMLKHTCFWADWWAEDWNAGLGMRSHVTKFYSYSPGIDNNGTEWTYQRYTKHKDVAMEPLLEPDEPTIEDVFRILKTAVDSERGGVKWNGVDPKCPAVSLFWRLIERCYYSATYCHVAITAVSERELWTVLGLSKNPLLWATYNAELMRPLSHQSPQAWTPIFNIADLDQNLRNAAPVVRAIRPAMGWKIREAEVFQRIMNMCCMTPRCYLPRLKAYLGEANYAALMACPIELAVAGEAVFYACERMTDDEVLPKSPTILSRKDDETQEFRDWFALSRDWDEHWDFREIECNFEDDFRCQPLDCQRGWFVMGGGHKEPVLMGHASFYLAMCSGLCLAPLEIKGSEPTIRSCLNIGFKILMTNELADRLDIVTTDIEGRDRRGPDPAFADWHQMLGAAMIENQGAREIVPTQYITLRNGRTVEVPLEATDFSQLPDCLDIRTMTVHFMNFAEDTWSLLVPNHVVDQSILMRSEVPDGFTWRIQGALIGITGTAAEEINVMIEHYDMQESSNSSDEASEGSDTVKVAIGAEIAVRVRHGEDSRGHTTLVVSRTDHETPSVFPLPPSMTLMTNEYHARLKWASEHELELLVIPDSVVIRMVRVPPNDSDRFWSYHVVVDGSLTELDSSRAFHDMLRLFEDDV
jgi:hypothetical protein